MIIHICSYCKRTFDSHTEAIMHRKECEKSPVAKWKGYARELEGAILTLTGKAAGPCPFCSSKPNESHAYECTVTRIWLHQAHENEE